MDNKPDHENSDPSESEASPSDDNGEEDEQQDTSFDGSDTTLPSGADRDRRRHSARNQERAEDGSAITLEGLITFFTYGSGVLLALIIVFFLYNQFSGPSGGAGDVQSNTGSNEREGVQIETGDNANIESLEVEGANLTTQAGRNKINDKMSGIISEIRDHDGFRSRHKEHLSEIKGHIQTLIDHIQQVSDSGSASSDLKQKADRASNNAEQLMKELINAYDGKKQVLDKINELNYDVLWEVQEQRDKVTGDQR